MQGCAPQADGLYALAPAGHLAQVGVIIVSYGNPEDVERCLRSIALSDWHHFEVFICENAGAAAFDRLVATVVGSRGPLIRADSTLNELDLPAQRLARVMKCRFSSRSNIVRLAEAS